MNLFKQIVSENRTVVMVTHNLALSKTAYKRYAINHGNLTYIV